MAKKHSRHTAPSLRQTRTRTRQNRGAALVSDPIQNTQQLNDQLRALGLYPAPTLGDGNCLFRALADQYYGSPSQHLKLRQEICDWMEAHKLRYAPFVDDERGLDVHLRCMRQPGTYGGHLELTAFAHLKRRDVKVIQPGLVYVIEWTLGADLSPTTSTAPLSEQTPSPPSIPLRERDTWRTRREKKELKGRVMKANKAARISRDEFDNGSDEENDSSSLGPVYVAYHDWEHFSSVRNLTGPHTGIPYVVEKPAATSLASQARTTTLTPQSSASSVETSPAEDDVEDDAEEQDESLDSPSTIPLPASRPSSPCPSSEVSATGSSLSVPPVPGYNCPPDSTQNFRQILRIDRSPKRAYDTADDTAEDSQGEAKRSRRNSEHRESRRIVVKTNMDTEIDPDADTPELLSSAESSSGSSSPAATPPPSMVIVPPSPVACTKPLTRRQRKKLGLPKPRSTLGSSAMNQRKTSAGKIVVPGGKFKKSTLASAASEPDSTAAEEWSQNGSGRVDVRGFKELKI